ncbi:MAG: PAS domain-containing protein [Cytophagales bacterium]|nr:PAS domain-containing protein [Cytophagales bacterium]
MKQTLFTYYFLLFSLWATAQESKLQSRPLQFEHLSMKDGLSMNPVMSIVQDKKGFLWFGTQDGLNRFDGYKFKVFKTKDDDSNSISDNFITTLFADRPGNLWIGTFGGGLNRYDIKTGKFKRFYKSSSSGYGLKNDLIWSFESVQSKLWIGTDKGIVVIDPVSEEFVNILEQYPSLEKLSGSTVLCIFRDTSGKLWFGTTYGLLLFQPDNGKLTTFLHNNRDPNSLSHNTVLKVFEDSKNNLWVGTIDGLNKYDPGSESFTNYFFKEERRSVSEELEATGSNTRNTFSLINNYSGNTIRCVFEDEVGIFWIGTDMELIRFDPLTGDFVNYKKDLINPTGINDHFIRTLYKDRSNNLWIGTMGSGLNKVNLKPKKFILYQKRVNDPISLSANYIRAIHEDNRGNIWIGTLIGGLNRFDPQKEKFYHYPKSDGPAENSPNDNNVWSLCTDSRGWVWIGTNNGLNRYDPISRKFKHYVYNKNDPTSISENTIRGIFQDSKGNLWVGTEKGLNKFDYESEKFKHYIKNEGIASPPTRNSSPDSPYSSGSPLRSDLARNAEISNSISNNTVWKIIEDRTGNLWLATNDGLNKFDPESEKFTIYKKVQGNIYSLSHNGVRTLYEDTKGNLWVGTQNGLNQFDPASGTFIRYDESSGLPNAFIYGILEDDEGHLWISTNKGISSFTPPTSHPDTLKGKIHPGFLKQEGSSPFKGLGGELGAFRNFDIYDGLQDYEFNTNACYKTKSGEMYFAGPRGLNRFDPSSLAINTYDPPIEITAINVLNQPFESELEISEIREITLNYDQNILYFEFSSLDYTNPSRNQYKYKMEGFNRDWIFCENVRFTTYTNLDPGEYVFKVKGTNSDGIWHEKAKAIQIIITPPFWKTGWFRTLIIIFLIMAVVIYVKLREQNLKRQKRILEEKVKERTQKINVQKDELEQINETLNQTNIELEKLSIVARETDNAVIIANAYGELEWVNEGFTKMTGYNLEEFVKEKGNSLTEISGNPEIKEIIDDCITNKKTVVYETHNNDKSGKEFWVQTTITPIIDNDNGKLKKLVIIDSDITEIKLAEEEIKQKNKNITDSISYASKIQEAILPGHEEFADLFPESFILFKPKDIVSGDFYWISPPLTPSPPKSEKRGIGETERKKTKQFTDSPIHPFTDSVRNSGGGDLGGAGRGASTVIFAVCDCTGHGVPGAFMSMIGNAMLNEIVIENGITQADMILKQLRDHIIKALGQTGKAGEQQDGMDIAICVMSIGKGHVGSGPRQSRDFADAQHVFSLQFAGAYNPLWIVRKGELIEIKADRQPIGIYEKLKPFTKHDIELQKRDMLYIFSDGYADQFGGNSKSEYGQGQKFKRGKFKKLLLSIHNKSMEQQKQILDTTIEEWRGNIEQGDDICVVGVRV